MTSNLDCRLKSYNRLSKNGWTKKFRPWVMIHKEDFNTKTEALKRDEELNSYKGREFNCNHIIKGLNTGY